jgi:hypothetical protein
MNPDPAAPLGLLFIIIGIFAAVLIRDEFRINKTKNE